MKASGAVQVGGLTGGQTGALVDELSANRKVMEQIRAIHETVNFGASNNQMPSPLLHRRTMK